MSLMTKVCYLQQHSSGQRLLHQASHSLGGATAWPELGCMWEGWACMSFGRTCSRNPVKFWHQRIITKKWETPKKKKNISFLLHNYWEIYTHLLCKRRWWDDKESLEKAFVGQTTRLEHKHPGVEVQRRRRTHLGRRPCNLVRALLAIPNFVLRRVTPCFLTEAIHDSIEVSIRSVKEVIYVVEHLDVRVQIYHLAVLLKLQRCNTIKTWSSDS